MVILKMPVWCVQVTHCHSKKAANHRFLAGPPAQGEVRIVGGTTYQRGRVEVYYGTAWGTLCGLTFSTEEAQVTCRELGVSVVTGMYYQNK